MSPEVPILVVTLHIPVQHDTSVGQVMEAVGQEIEQAIEAAKGQLDEQEPLEEQPPVARETPEALEPTSEATADDLLTALGYIDRSSR